MKRIITFLTPCIRNKNSDYALMVSTMSMVVGVLRLVCNTVKHPHRPKLPLRAVFFEFN